MEGIEHQLFGYIDGNEACSAARWAGDAKTAIAAAHARDVLPILVGGTGMYVRVLLDGIAPIPDIDADIRQAVRKMEALEAYRELEKLDPVSAERLHSTDTTRIQRALEVIRSTGKPLDHWHENKTGGIADEIVLHPLVLLSPREWLYQRCDLRLHQMIDAGAAVEVEALLSRHLSAHKPVMRAIGVPEIARWLSGDIGQETAIEQAQAATRQYAKRQYTWFRNQCPADWARAEEPLNNDNRQLIEILLRN